MRHLQINHWFYSFFSIILRHLSPESVTPPGFACVSCLCLGIVSVMSCGPRCPTIPFTAWPHCCRSPTSPLSTGVWKLCWRLWVAARGFRRRKEVKRSSLMTPPTWKTWSRLLVRAASQIPLMMVTHWHMHKVLSSFIHVAVQSQKDWTWGRSF